MSTALVLVELLFSCWLFSFQEEKLINTTTRSNSGIGRGERRDYKSQTENSFLISPELATILESHDTNMSGGTQHTWEDFREDKFITHYGALIVLCVLCFTAYLGEGSVSDWSAIYYRERFEASPLVCTLGYVSFECVIAITRLSSDHLVLLVGRRRLLQGAGLLACTGLVLAAAASWLKDTSLGERGALGVSMVGFGVSGLGIGVVAPSVISIAGTVPNVPPSDAIGLVSSIGYIGVMVGPPLLGGVSALCGGLEWSYVVDGGLMLCITLLAFYISADNEREEGKLETMSQPLLRGVGEGQEEHLIQ
ncbi:MFS transporter [archaeon]|nr:MAG: MFS transporter [archaeon]